MPPRAHQDLEYRLGRKFGFDPDSDDLAPWMARAIAATGGEEAELERACASAFLSVTDPPSWVQQPEWPACGGEPMVFVSQTEVKRGTFGLRHDATMYLFWSPRTGETRVVTQAD